MKHLLLTTSIFALFATVGACSGEEDASDVFMPPLGSTSGTSSTAGTTTAPTGSNGMMPNPATSMTNGPTPTAPMMGPNPGEPEAPPPVGGGGTGPNPGPVPTAMPTTPVEEPPAPFCGDGNVDTGEVCDDANRVAADGCENDCTETIEAVATCGDGMMDDGEACDDGNDVPADGCENNCTVTPAAAFCGDGMRDPDEDCDDGNIAGGDGCEADCTVTPPPEPVCPNGMMEEGEACDDGNDVPADGCEPDCTLTPEPAAVPTVAELVSDLDGSLVVTPCADNPSTDDCNSAGWSLNGSGLTACVNNQLEAIVDFPVGGVAGTRYAVDMHFYGVMEPRIYADVTREANGSPSRDEGGTPTPYAWADPNTDITGAGDQNYNTYEVHVLDENGQEVSVQFINADAGTGHYTLAINYAKTIELVGGGSVRLRIYDQNCRQIKNCGANGGAPCSGKARSINISGADPQPGNLLMQPGLGQPEAHSGQWWLIDVTNVALVE